MTPSREELSRLHSLTGEMLALAEANHFEELSERLDQYLALAAQLTRSDTALEGENAALAREILDRQRRIEAAVGPWLEQTRRLFRDNSKERSLAKAYRTAE